MIIQKEIKLKAKKRGFHLITEEIINHVDELKQVKLGIMNVFIKHTSAALTINENADPSVRQDFENYFNKFVPENEPYYTHVDEGSDDLPAHLKSSILGSTLSIPITNGKLNMGIWQAIYLCEHRNYAGNRSIVITIIEG